MSTTIGVLIWSLLCSMSTSAPQGEDAVVREVVLARFERLQNLIVDYEVTTRYTPQIPLEDIVRKSPQGKLIVMDTGIRVTSKQISILDDRYMSYQKDESWERGIDHPDLAKAPSLGTRSYVRTPDRTEQLQGHAHPREVYVGGISNYGPIVEAGELEASLGLRMLNEFDPLTRKDIERMTLTRTPDGKVRLRATTSRGAPNEWLLDPDLGYAAVWYGMYGPTDDKPWAEYQMEDFKAVDGLLLPFRINGTWRMEPNCTIRTEAVVVRTYRLDAPENTPERYRIQWPDGASVVDSRARLAFRAEGGRLRPVDDNRISKMALDEISKSLVRESNAAKEPTSTGDSHGTSQTQAGYPHEPNAVAVATASPGSNMRLWWGVVPLVVVAVGGVLRLRRSRQSKGSAD